MRIKTENLEFSYSKKRILNEVNMDVYSGELVSVLGPNGAGKSTLIKCIDGLLKTKKGVLKVNGKNIKSIDRISLAKEIGYVPQTSSTVFPLTVFDMVLLGRRPHQKWNSEDLDRKKVIKALKLMNIEHLAMNHFDQLSGGQQQKVVIARTIAQDTDILLLDEATSNLDIRHQLEVMEIMRDLVDAHGKSVIMIVHDLNIASRYSDRVIIMKNGEVLASGKPHEVITEENINLVYDVEAKISEVEGKPYVLPLKVKYA